ncbi:membrane-spanning 4-domains subfamily A member 6C isoform X1 [Nothobranchius furzeri]|uniref:LOC107379129-like protein n=2 Tax=Nothobranchius furzeri TaxID=105023 RepID=A0A9D2YT28_NOTFU|nr:putative LOC107379129-like protein [Nothobranchius furzeri]
MSISAFKENRVTVISIETQEAAALTASHPQSVADLLVGEQMMQSSVAGALGTVQILVGVFNVGLGPERTGTYPYWLGALFIAAGVVSILAEAVSLPCLVGFSAIVNIVVSISSIVGIVLYAIHLASFTVIWMCGQSDSRKSDNCAFLAGLAKRLLTGMDITLIVMSVLQLCVCISLAVLSIKSLCNRARQQSGKEVEIQQPASRKSSELVLVKKANSPELQVQESGNIISKSTCWPLI